MKITVYTTSDCQFSKQEKEYLASHNLQYEEKNLESNKEFLTEMLAVSNNFAGTPVTKIEKNNGQIAVLKGFTKEEFDKTLGSSPPPQPTTNPQPPITAVPPVPPPAPSPTTNPEPPITDSPQQELNSVLNDLQAKMDEPKPPTTNLQPPVTAVPPAGAPSIPDFGPKQ